MLSASIIKLHRRSWWRSLLARMRLPIMPVKVITVDIPFVQDPVYDHLLSLPENKYGITGNVDKRTTITCVDTRSPKIVSYEAKVTRTSSRPKSGNKHRSGNKRRRDW